MSDEIAKRVAARFCAAQDEDGPHDPSNGVLHDWQYEALADKGAWKGYRYSVAVWSWDTTNEDQDEPDDWGDNTMRGPLRTMDEVLEAVKKTPFSWSGEWIDAADGSFQSKVKKTKKLVTQGIAAVERVDGKPLTYEERRHIEYTLKLKR